MDQRVYSNLFIFFTLAALLTLASCAKATSKGDTACVQLTYECTQELVSSMFSHGSDAELICRDFADFFECLRGPACAVLSDRNRLKMANQMKVNLGQQNLDCPDLSVVRPQRFTPETVTRQERLQTTEQTDGNNDCVEDAKKCTENYVNGIHQHAATYGNSQGSQNFGWTCPLVLSYVSCIEAMPCTQTEQRNKNIESLQVVLGKWGVSCDFEIRPGNSAENGQAGLSTNNKNRNSDNAAISLKTSSIFVVLFYAFAVYVMTYF